MDASDGRIAILPHLVWQWAVEPRKISYYFKIYVNYSNANDNPPVKVWAVLNKLDKDHFLFHDGKKNDAVVIITSYQTLNIRHGSAKQAEWWVKKNKHQKIPDQTVLHRTFPDSLSGLFKIALLDEVHMLWNVDSLLSIMIKWLDADFNLLLILMLAYNSL